MSKIFLEKNEIKSDELGRFIVDDLNLLEKINGAMLGGPDFMLSDGACGNENCVC